jgi:hypothetical protein
MTEEELIEEGFTRIDILIEESGDKNDYHYYIFSFGNGFSLYSSENTDSPGNKWRVNFDEFSDNITDIEDVQTLLALFKKWKVI